MKKIITSVTLLLAGIITIYAQPKGMGTNDPEAKKNTGRCERKV